MRGCISAIIPKFNLELWLCNGMSLFLEIIS